MRTQNSAPPASRWIELDGVRGLAALLVVYVHLFLRWIPDHPAPVFWLRTLSGMSWSGVDLFFILSGFLIGGILLRNREADNYFGVFYLRRAFRILPLYFTVLAVFFILRFTSVGAHHGFEANGIPFWTYPLLIQNFPMAWSAAWGALPLGVTWSIAIEEQFYLFLPLLIRFIPIRTQFVVFAGLACIGPVFRATVPVAAPTFLLPGSIEPLFVGVLLAWLDLHRPALFSGKGWRVLALALFALGACAMVWLSIRGGFGVFRETAITVFWGAFLWLALAFRSTAFTAPLRWKPLCWVGGVSYGVYLLHLFVAHWVFLIVYGGGLTETRGAPAFLLTCGITILIFGIAALSARFFERPLTTIGHRYVYRKADKAAQPLESQFLP